MKTQHSQKKKRKRNVGEHFFCIISCTCNTKGVCVKRVAPASVDGVDQTGTLNVFCSFADTFQSNVLVGRQPVYEWIKKNV